MGKLMGGRRICTCDVRSTRGSIAVIDKEQQFVEVKKQMRESYAVHG